MANVLLAAGLIKKPEDPVKKLLQEETPDADALSRELSTKALSCALDTKVSFDEPLFFQAEEIVRRGIDVPEAHLILTRCYQDGIFVEKSRTTSSFHLAEAARKGNHAARYLVALQGVDQDNRTLSYKALADLIDLALNGAHWKIKEAALWRAVLKLRSTLELNTLSPEDAQFMSFYEVTFKGGDPGLKAFLTDAIADFSEGAASMTFSEDAEGKAANAKAKQMAAKAKVEKSEVEKWREYSRAFLSRHHDRIKALGDPEMEVIPSGPTHLGRSGLPPKTQDAESLNIPMRTLTAATCILLGFLFFPLFFVGGLIAWSIYRDIVDAPAHRAQKAEIEARVNAPMSVEEIRGRCESPAETAFLDAMVSAYDLRTGPGSIVGRGLRLRNQFPMGNLRTFSNYVSWQYRADFLVDEKLVVEIDGATYHSSPDAVARDRQRDADMIREGYTVLRIPAQVVFQDPTEAVRRVEDARKELSSNRSQLQ